MGFVEQACPGTQATHVPVALHTPPAHIVPEGAWVALSLHANLPAVQVVMPRRQGLELVEQL